MKKSVCIATYNGETYIREQLESIIKQLNEDDEIIISDDNSTDNTIGVIKSFADERIKIFLNKLGKGHIQNFGNALSYATGDLIFLADQDDVWHDEKVKKFSSHILNCDLIICNCQYVDRNLNPINGTWFESMNARQGFLKNLYKNTYLGCCLAFNKKVLNAVLPIPKNINSHDTWIGLIAELTGKVFFLDEKLHFFRRHGANFSSLSGVDTMLQQKSPYSFKEKMVNRFVILYNLLVRLIQLKFQ